MMFAWTRVRRHEKGHQCENMLVTVGSGPRDTIVGAHFDAVALPNGTLCDPTAAVRLR